MSTTIIFMIKKMKMTPFLERKQEDDTFVYKPKNVNI